MWTPKPLKNMANETGNANLQNSDKLNELLDVNVEELDETALREKLIEIIPKYNETHQSNKQLFERAKTAEGGLKELKEKIKTLEEASPEPIKVAPEPKSELDNGDYALLTAKGIEDEDEIDFIHKRMTKWDMNLREVLKDEDVQSKLKAMRQEREVKNATPSSTKRGGGQSNDFDLAYAKYEQTGKLPDDFDLRLKVVNAKLAKEEGNKPSWK